MKVNKMDEIKDKSKLRQKATDLWLTGKTWGDIMETLDISDEILEDLIGWRPEVF